MTPFSDLSDHEVLERAGRDDWQDVVEETSKGRPMEDVVSDRVLLLGSHIRSPLYGLWKDRVLDALSSLSMEEACAEYQCGVDYMRHRARQPIPVVDASEMGGES